MIIRNGNVVLKNSVEKKDILIENGKIVKILMAKVCEETNEKAGVVVECKDRLVISCKDKNIEVLKIQPEGKKQMDIGEFLKGNSIFKEMKEI